MVISLLEFAKIRTAFTLVLIAFVLTFCKSDSDASPPQSQRDRVDFLGISPSTYLIGNFSGEKIFPSLTNPKESNPFYLHPEALKSLEAMKEDFETYRKGLKPPYNQHIFLVSSFRSFAHQKKIWEEKFTGKRKMREPITGKSPTEIVDLILEYSSAPGTSRHHWGTDLDLNALENTYFEKGGKGEVLYAWLVQNASKYGFCQPYNSNSSRGNQGYKEEKWHWSYKPLSKPFTKQWLQLYDEGNIQLKGKFLGSEVLGDLPRVYVSSINPECLN